MKKGYQGFCITIPANDPKQLEHFNKVMQEVHDAIEKDIQQISSEFGISYEAACHVQYLRSRTRWTQEKEDYLIQLDKEGKSLPNIFEDFIVPEKE